MHVLLETAETFLIKTRFLSGMINRLAVRQQCDQIGRFIGLWATFLISLPKSPASLLGNSCKGVKIYNFLVKSFLGNFYRHLATFTGHTAR